LETIKKFLKNHQLSSKEAGGKGCGGENANQPMKKRMGLLADSEMESKKGMNKFW